MMSMYKFKEVSVKGIRRWKDADGKRHQETKTFSQTINPFNKNTDGSQKSRSEIYAEICAERDEWVSAK